MKLFKKLLPLTAIATTVAIVTPLAVSCTNETKNAYSTADVAILSKGTYSRQAAVKPLESYKKIADVEKMYFEDITKNNQILVDDIFEGIQYGILYGNLPSISTTYRIRRVMDGSIGVKILDINANKKTVSVEVKFDDVRYALSRNRSTTISTVGHVNSTITLKNIPLKLDYYPNPEGYNEWSVFFKYFDTNSRDIDLWSLKNDKNWSVKFDRDWSIHLIDSEKYRVSGEIVEAEEIDEELMSCNWNANDSKHLEDAASIFEYIIFDSNYLANISLR